MMNKMRIPVIISFLIFISCAEDREKFEVSDYKVDSLTTALEKQKNISDSLISILQKKEDFEEPSSIYFGKAFDTIPHPERFIKSALAQKPEIIPLNPVLGGKMQFRRIEILNDKWLYALYDDGHIQGTAIYEYQLKPDGELAFHILLSRSP